MPSSSSKGNSGEQPTRRGKRFFVSFEFEHDLANARNLIAQARSRGYEAPPVDLSLRRSGDGSVWQQRAREAIQKCQLVVVLLGPSTHNAPGVEREIRFAKELGKQIIQIRPQGSRWTAHPLLRDKPVLVWKWDQVGAYFDSD